MLKAYLDGELSWHQFSSDEIARLRVELNLTQKGLGALLKVTQETVRRWETEAEDVPDAINTVLCVLSKLGCGVFRLMEDDAGTFELVQSPRVNMNLAQDVDDPRYNLTAAEIEDQGKAPDSFDAETVKELRRRLGMNRRQFAEFVGISLSTAVNWENGSVVPKGSALALLKVLWKWGKSALDFN